MGHNEYYLLVNGVHEADIITDAVDFKVLASNDPGSTPATKTEWLDDLAADAAEGPDSRYEVFVIHHGDHELYEDCECVQFETDHNPVWERNAS